MVGERRTIMCMCGKPTKNGEYGYVWNDARVVGVYPVNPPALREGDELIYDEPGRCGRLDCHSHHFRLVRNQAYHYLLARHGGGDHRIELGSVAALGLRALEVMDSDARYWMLHTLYSVSCDEARSAREDEARNWRRAALEKRIKVRRRGGRVRVEVVPALLPAGAEPLAAMPGDR